MRRVVVMLLFGSLFSSGASAQFPKAADLPVQAELPDPLRFADGTVVKTKEDWVAKRRPELKARIAHYMYGNLPTKTGVKATLLHEDPKAYGGKATLREVALDVGYGDARIRLLVVAPNGMTDPVPCFVGPNFSGNHTFVDDPKVAVPTGWVYDKYPGVTANKASEAGRGKLKPVWNIEETIARGFATATFYNGDIDPDRPDVRDGIRPHLPKEFDTSTIACWAWGVQRCVDYLETLPAVDAKKLVAVGHSRLGKTVLLAAAFDERIAAAIPLQAGCGGTAPSRGTVGESVKQINDRFPHWFNAEFKTFNVEPARLPFDQHSLVALCAPRPVLFANAVEDQWANPAGQFDVLKGAHPVYRVHGVEGLSATQMPEAGTLINSRLAYFYRPGKHEMKPEDWTAFYKFVEKWLAGK
jgi:hypothetical protein